jgi:MmgE/PrpD N-terminal domain
MPRSAPEPLSVRLVRLLGGLPRDTAALQTFAIEHITDTFAVALAATPTEQAQTAVRATLRGTAGGPCGVIGTDAGAPPIQAAFANAALAHILDFDDIHDTARLHPTTVTLPGALAAAELAGASGKALICGVLLGSELMCRLGEAVTPTGTGPAAHWFLTQLFGYLGAAMAAGVTLGLEPEELVSAIGLAAMQAAGSKQVHGRVDLTTMAAACLSDTSVLDLAAKLEVVETLPDGPGHPPAHIQITTSEGRTLVAGSDPARLDASPEQRRSKLAGCMARTSLADPAAAARALADAVHSFPVARMVRAPAMLGTTTVSHR